MSMYIIPNTERNPWLKLEQGVSEEDGGCRYETADGLCSLQEEGADLRICNEDPDTCRLPNFVDRGGMTFLPVIRKSTTK